MSYTTDYCKLVDKHDMNQAPSLLMALHKLDENKDPTKRKALFDAVATAITKWDATWTAELKKVTDQKDKLARSQFAVDVRKMKQAIQADAGKAVPYDKPLPPIPGKAPYDRPLPPIPGKGPPNRPLPPIPGKGPPNRPLPPIPGKVPPAPPLPPIRGKGPNNRPLPPIPTKAASYKKTTFGSAYLKARAEVPVGAVAIALWNLDNAATLEEAKPLALAAQKVLGKALAELDADLKTVKDEDRKLKVKGLRLVVNQLLGKVKTTVK